MQSRILTTISAFAIAVSALATAASAQTELRITWYNDGIEGEVMREILDRYEAANSDVTVTLDIVPYKAILESLPVQLAAGEGPDIARVTDLGRTVRTLSGSHALYFRSRILGKQFWTIPQMASQAR